MARTMWIKRKHQLQVCNMFQERHDFVLNIVIAKRTHASLGNPKEVDDEGLLMDVDVQPINKDAPSREDKRCDVDHFFQSATEKIINGKAKKYCRCKLCPYVSHTSVMCLLMRSICRDKKSLVNEVTTLRRHLEAHHSVSLLLFDLLLYLRT